MSNASEKPPSTAASGAPSVQSTEQPPATGVRSQSGCTTVSLDQLREMYVDPETGDTNGELSGQL